MGEEAAGEDSFTEKRVSKRALAHVANGKSAPERSSANLLERGRYPLARRSERELPNRRRRRWIFFA